MTTESLNSDGGDIRGELDDELAELAVLEKAFAAAPKIDPFLGGI